MPQKGSSEPASALKKLRWLVDENVALAVAAFLRAHGDEVLDVKEAGWFGLSDAELFARAQRDGRVLLTYDAHFADLRKLRTRHPGIVFVRLRDLRPDQVVAAFGRFLAAYGKRDLTNTLAVLEETRVRFRRTR